MVWTTDDEMIFRALHLEQRLSGEGPTNDLGGQPPMSFEGIISALAAVRTECDLRWYKMGNRKWWADPLNPLNILMLLILIPLNVIYIFFSCWALCFRADDRGRSLRMAR